MTRYLVTVTLFGVAVLAVCLFATAQRGNGQTPPNPGPQPPTYRPGLGDLMTMTVQPRHIKLGLAGREKNWAYAAYELHELEESFERVSRHSPQWRKKPIADMMTSVTKDPMAALEQAIRAADAERFRLRTTHRRDRKSVV